MISNEKAIALLKILARYTRMTYRAEMTEAILRGLEVLEIVEKLRLDKEKILMEAKQGRNGSKRALRVRLERVLTSGVWFSEMSVIACSVCMERVMELVKVFRKVGYYHLRLGFKLTGVNTTGKNVEGGDAYGTKLGVVCGEATDSKKGSEVPQ